MVDDLSFRSRLLYYWPHVYPSNRAFRPNFDWFVIGLTTHKKKIYSQEGFIMLMYWNAEAISKA